MGELDTLLNVALEALGGSLQEGLLLAGQALEGVDGLLGSIGLCARKARVLSAWLSVNTHERERGRVPSSKKRKQGVLHRARWGPKRSRCLSSWQ